MSSVRTPLATSIAAAAALSLGAAPSARAQEGLVSSDPLPNAALATAPPTVELTFGTALRSRGNSISVTFPGGATITRQPTVKDRTLSAPLGATKNGAYHVTWHATSSSGSALAGGFDFSVRRSSGGSSTAGQNGLTPPSSSTVAGPTTPTVSEPGDNQPALVIGVTGLLSAGLLLAWFALRRRVKDDPH